MQQHFEHRLVYLYIGYHELVLEKGKWGETYCGCWVETSYQCLLSRVKAALHPAKGCRFPAGHGGHVAEQNQAVVEDIGHSAGNSCSSLVSWMIWLSSATRGGSSFRIASGFHRTMYWPLIGVCAWISHVFCIILKKWLWALKTGFHARLFLQFKLKRDCNGLCLSYFWHLYWF